jgi:tetratricopeptide (TPR) repeat protein
MRLTFMAGAVAALSLTGVPAVSGAQPGGVSASCTIDVNSPKELALQQLAFQQAKAAQNPEQRRKVLAGIVKELDTKPERFAKNRVGHQFMLSEAIKMWALEPDMPAAPQRGQVGFVTNPTEPVDLIEALDASYKAVVEANPACADDMKAQRQNEVWLAQTQAALSASNSGNADSAEFYAKRSMLLSNGPYPHYVLANVANQRNDKKNAVMHWKHVIDLAGSDTSYSDLKNGSMYYVAMTQLEMAGSAQGDEQVALGKAAAEAFKALVDASPNSPDVSNFYNGWADAVTLAKDTAAIPSVYARLLASPEQASDMSLTVGGVIAARANRTDDALKLFDAAVKRNGNNRDALRNLAATHYGKDQYKEMFDPTRQLVAIDPNNYDAWMMFAYASQGLGKNAKAPAEKRAWTDSLVKYQTMADNLPVKVEVAGFSRGAESATLTLALEQMAATGSYDVTAEFLDAQGQVVATATQPTGPLKKGETKTVELKATGNTIYGYRYKPLK